jgi:hypothetical protein
LITMGKWADMTAGKQPCSFCSKKWKSSEVRVVDTGSRARVTVCQEFIARGHDITEWPHDPYDWSQDEEGASDEREIPEMDELYDLSDEDAFQQIAVEVPELLALREVLGPEPAPVPTDLPLREFMRQRRNGRKGPSGASQREWESRVREVTTELRRLVGPDALHGSELVRSDIALFKCAQALLPIGSDRSPDDGEAAP